MTSAAASRQSELPLAAASIVALVAVNLAWGLNWVFGKIGLESIPPLMFTGLRFLCLFLLLFPFMKWHKGHYRDLIIVGIGAGAGNFGLMFIGLSLADDIAPVAIAIQLSIPIATLLAALFLGERIGFWRAGALVLAFAGILVVGFDPLVFNYAGALALVILAAFLWAVASIFMRRLRHIGVFDMQAWIAVMSFPPLLLASFLLEGNPIAIAEEAPPIAWLALAYTIFVTSLIGHGGVYWLLRRHAIGQIGPYLLLVPVIAALSGVVVLDDNLSWRMVVGGLMTLAGVFVITIREGRRAGAATVAKNSS